MPPKITKKRSKKRRKIAKNDMEAEKTLNEKAKRPSKRIFGQPLTEEEFKAYIPNRNLELIGRTEINRLRKVIEEKNDLILRYKKHDAERSVYLQRLKKSHDMMEEQYNEWKQVIDDENGKASSKKFNKLIQEYKDKKQCLSSCESGLGNIQKSLTDISGMLKEILDFSMTDGYDNSIYYQNKINSIMSYISSVRSNIIGYNILIKRIKD